MEIALQRTKISHGFVNRGSSIPPRIIQRAICDANELFRCYLMINIVIINIFVRNNWGSGGAT